MKSGDVRPPTLFYFKVTLTIWDTLRFQMNFSCQPNFLSSLCLKWSHSFAQLFATPPGQNTRMGSLSLLQGIIPTQGSNQSLSHCRCILYQLSYQGSLVTQISRRIKTISIPSIFSVKGLEYFWVLIIHKPLEYKEDNII